MRSNIISKDKAKALNIEVPFTGKLKSSSGFTDFSALQGYPKTAQEKQQIDKLLDQYFLYRNENLERAKKFLDFFHDEVKQESRTKPAQKFVDFLILKNISGTRQRKHSAIVEPQDINEMKKWGEENIRKNLNEVEPNPSLIYNDSGDIVGLRFQCSCGEEIKIDFEFE
jgi:hypothetical protein